MLLVNLAQLRGVSEQLIGLLHSGYEMKPRPNHRLYIQALRSMSPEARSLKCFALTEFSRELFLHGLRRRFPDKSDDEVKKIHLERLTKCHNRNC